MTEQPTDAMLLSCPNPWCKRILLPRSIRYTGGTPQTYPWHVLCQDCDLRGPSCKTEAEAIAAWNTRTPSTPAIDDEGLRAAAIAAESALDKLVERWVQSEQPTDEEGQAATAALMAISKAIQG